MSEFVGKSLNDKYDHNSGQPAACDHIGVKIQISIVHAFADPERDSTI